nr:hypothetical protein Iba_chr05aCG4080 [Ipomoea batatas]GMC93575.1 hypothetical protein Iba_chr05bCG3680 [Ipomoea batatas]GMC97395.1 hypothetical protein Iba_chr05dCG6600 [Ipomoea batatas]GMC99505.1 hypothetical protein Iba_chr05eCG6330 [Ipomoea batatas]
MPKTIQLHQLLHKDQQLMHHMGHIYVTCVAKSQMPGRLLVQNLMEPRKHQFHQHVPRNLFHLIDTSICFRKLYYLMMSEN